MKLKFQKDDALRIMQHLQGIVGTKSMLPILSHIIMETSPRGVEMIASDLEIWISCSLPAEVAEAGASSIPGRRLFNIIKEMPGAGISLETGEDNVTRITCARSFFQLKGLPREEFPAAPDLKNAVAIKIRQAELKSLIKKTAYAISLDETRHFMNGLHLIFEEGELTAVATDGRRMAMAKTECVLPADFKKEIILPYKAVQELGRILEDDGECVIKLGDRQVAFEFPGILMISRLVEGRFPDYRQVIPQEQGTTLELPRLDFMQVVKRASLINDEKSNSVRFTFGNKLARISAVTPDVGEARDELQIDYDGEEIEIAFNPIFIIDVLKALDDEDKIKLQLINPESPGVFKTDGRFLCVLMPMKL